MATTIKLYRARRLSERPRRITSYEGGGPHQRIKGRWYTSQYASAQAHAQRMAAAGSPVEIVVVEIDAEIAESFRVATTPHTPCGLDPLDYSNEPETDYVVPTWIGRTAEPVNTQGIARKRDVIDVRRPYGPGRMTNMPSAGRKVIDVDFNGKIAA